MTAVLVDDQPTRPHVRPVSDGRPPGQTWAPPGAAQSPQPTLWESEPAVLHGPPRPVGHRVHRVGVPRGTDPRSLPDPGGWSSSLALAFAEALQGRRPVGQLSRWVDEPVLAVLVEHSSGHRGRTRRAAGAGTSPVLRSVHLQFPAARTVEASAHVQLGERSWAMAFRLVGCSARWLCTALELAPRDG